MKQIIECVQLAIMGGKECSFRGMDLNAYTADYNQKMARAFNLELLIESQTVLVERARRIYNAKAIAQEEAILSRLHSLVGLSVSEQRHGITDLLFEPGFEEH